MKYLRLIVILVMGAFSLYLISCESDSNGSSYLPKARGAESEVILVMDSADWNSELGDEVRQTFSQAIPGLPQNEPYFSIKYVSPLRFGSILRQAKNIIFVTTLNNKSAESRKLRSYFTEESLKRIQEDTELYMFSNQDEFAQGQQILHLFGQTDEKLAEKIAQNRQELRNFFLKVEKDRISDKIYSARSERGIERALLNDHQFSLKVPSGYKLAKEKDNFIWIRNPNPEVDKNIIIYYDEYASEEVFESQNIFNLRDKIASQNLRDIEDSTIYITTEPLLPLTTKRVNFNGMYAVESRGLWKLNNNSLGGPFLSYIFVDEGRNRLYYIEGYVASPGEDKREPIRELETILWTFEPAEAEEQTTS
ncbi:MAG: DUF4837 family protein [Candidatus Cyclobacteriaceae bacterium M3_2C_046]